MRTTVRLDPDVAAAADQLRASRSVSLSEAVNTLARLGMERAATSSSHFVQRTMPIGIRVDISNVAEALELLDGVEHA